MQRIAVIATQVAVSTGAWSARAAPANIKSVKAAAHGAYVAAVSSNDTEAQMADLTDGIVYQAPVDRIVGKAKTPSDGSQDISAHYIRTTWEKTSIGFTVISDWVFGRYEDQATDVDGRRLCGHGWKRHRASTFPTGHQREMAGGHRRMELRHSDREITALPPALRRPLLAVSRRLVRVIGNGCVRL